MTVVEEVTPFVLGDNDVLCHYIFEPTEDMPYGWSIVVVQPGQAWENLMDDIDKNYPAAYLREERFARTTMDHFPNDKNVIGTMYFRADNVNVGMVAHESLHLASWMCRFIPNTKRMMSFGNEPEILADIVGQLTSITWYNIDHLQS